MAFVGVSFSGMSVMYAMLSRRFIGVAASRASISSAPMMVTGSDFSMSRRLMLEPVTVNASIRTLSAGFGSGVGAADWAAREPAVATTTEAMRQE
ncbi:MAG: hypothetical protein NTV51_28710 [Verrucomicrobia bacterium]|nr:hypothetical protein [Verrucomicrobiota bacterium]